LKGQTACIWPGDLQEDTMAAGPQLRNYQINLVQAQTNVKEVRSVVGSIDKAIDVVELAIDAVDAIEDAADRFGDKISSMKLALKLMDKAGPLKALAKVATTILDRVENVAKQVEKKAHDLAQRIDDAKLEEKLDKASDRLDDFDDALEQAELRLGSTAQSVASTIRGLDLVDQADPNGDPAASVSAAADTLVTPPNAAVAALNALYGGVHDKAVAVRDAVPSAGFLAVLAVRSAFDRIDGSLSFLQGPLQVVKSVLKPVEGLLDVVGFLFNITVGPVINFLMDSLGINKLIDGVAAKIGALLPNASVLDAVLAKFDAAFAKLDPLGAVDDALGITDWIERLTGDLLDPVGDPDTGPIGIGSNLNDSLVGSMGNDVLDGGVGHDTLLGGAGDDVLLAGPGNDVLDGGSGTDRAVFRGGFGEYDLVVDAAGTTITLVHQRPADRRQAEGRDETRDIEHYVFSDISLSREQLLDGVIKASAGQTVLNGTDDVDLMFGATTALTIDGRGGNDLIQGSPQSDTLRGGDGDDVFVSTDGSDSIDGGSGSDTWRFPINNASANPDIDIDLAAGTGFIARDRLLFVSVENLIVEDRRTAYLYGDGEANRLQASASRDILHGRAGDDWLDGGDGNDLLIGGAGSDTLLGGAGNDVLAAGEAAQPGVGNVYDGGDGAFDTVTYESDLRAHSNREHWSSFQQNKARFVEASGPVRVLGEQGVVERLAADGQTVLATDTMLNIETVIGSDAADQLFGAPGLSLNGGLGNDELHGGGSDGLLDGGEGDDVVFAGTGGMSADGGGGFDILDMTAEAGVRWLVKLDGSIGSSLRAFNALEGDGLAVPGIDLRNDWGAALLGSGNVGNFDVYRSGPEDDYFELRSFGAIRVEAGDGNDELRGRNGGSNSPSFELLGQGGDDHIVLQDQGLADGGEGDDDIEIDASASADVTVRGGDGDDLIQLRGGTVQIDGGDGIDTLAGAPRNALVGLDVDLAAGTVKAAGGGSRIGGSVTGIEVLLGTDDFADILRGGAAGEQIAGGGGNDLLEGRGGRDALYGGNGNDTLRGGDGDDLLHGGLGADAIDGGSGIDTASWAFAAPSIASGGQVASALGTVDADLALGTARVSLYGGGSETDGLVAIENLFGGEGNDTLRGDAADNLLAGSGGSDLLEGRAGNDTLILDGDDRALGGDGDDRFVIGLGRVTIEGGAGVDTLDFGTLRGQVTVDAAAGVYTAQLQVDRPVWREGGGTESRSGAGVTLTPQQVLEADPAYANSLDDIGRILPTDSLFEIDLVTVTEVAGGSFTGVEQFVAGSAELQLFLSGADQSLEGSDDAIDVADYSRAAQGIDLDLSLPGAPLVHVDELQGTPFADRVKAGAQAMVLRGGAGDDVLQGGPDNDILQGDAGDDLLIGGDGTDRARFDGGRGDYTLTALDGTHILAERAAFGGRNGIDTLVDVERIVFADGGVALDLDGSAGQVAKLLGAVFGREAVQVPAFVGIGLDYADTGIRYDELGAIALREAGATTPQAIVDLLWTHVVGTPPTPAQAQPYVGLLEAGMHPGDLAVFAAETDENAANINLVGLAETGLAYG
jgi:Ca2+-binding RTX toxin-like protein